MNVDILPDVGVPPSYNWSVQGRKKVRVIKLGDGYEQRMGVGLNRKERILQLTWEHLDLDQNNILYDFIMSRDNGEAVLVPIPSTGELMKTVSGDPRYYESGYDTYTLTCSFREIYE